MVKTMKSVVIFDPSDSDEQTANKYIDWLRHNKLKEIRGRYVPNAEETRKYLSEYR